MNDALKLLKLTRKDGKAVDVIFYDNDGLEEVKILDIKTLKFEGMKTKDIKKSLIRDIVFGDEEKLYLKNKSSNITALLPRKHLAKIISTVFRRDIESRYSYLKKEIISNVGVIFYKAVPILKHPELKSEILYEYQYIHRFALPLKIGGVLFLVMITLKERIDYKSVAIDEFAIYDLYSEAQTIKNPLGSSSTASVGDTPMTTRSQYQMDTLSINDLTTFVNRSITNFG